MPDEKQDEWTCEDWIKKLKYQAEDSREYRHKLYEKVDLKNKKKILDVGWSISRIRCGAEMTKFVILCSYVKVSTGRPRSHRVLAASLSAAGFVNL